VPLDKNEVFVKAQFICAVREHRDVRPRGWGPGLRVDSRCITYMVWHERLTNHRYGLQRQAM